MLPCAFVADLQGLAVNIHQRSNMFKKAKWKQFTNTSDDTLNVFYRKSDIVAGKCSLLKLANVNLKAFSTGSTFVTKENLQM